MSSDTAPDIDPPPTTVQLLTPLPVGRRVTRVKVAPPGPVCTTGTVGLAMSAARPRCLVAVEDLLVGGRTQCPAGATAGEAGELVRGSMEAPSVADVVANLRTRALFVTTVDRETAFVRTLGR